MYFIARSELSGIGQVVIKYSELFKDSIRVRNYREIPPGSDVFFFALPLPEDVEVINYLKPISNSFVCMTVCETETVHPCYSSICNIEGLDIAVPSEFCKRVLDRQFGCSCRVLRHTIALPPNIANEPSWSGSKYVFYHIGNIIDPRKQVNKIVQAFEELDLPDSVLLLKATCNREVKCNSKNVVVLNKLMTREELDRIHDSCHCYVSFSHSEGVGMGAVEAAIRNKPVIITDYGGCVEYVKTPFLIPCVVDKVGFDDFLFKKEMEWGHPDYLTLKRHMKTCYEGKLTFQSHDHTRDTVNVSPYELYEVHH